MEESKKLTVTIYNESYIVKSKGDDEKILRVVNYVDQMMNNIGQQQFNLSYKDIAILTAMNITEEYFKLKDDYEQLIQLINEEE